MQLNYTKKVTLSFALTIFSLITQAKDTKPPYDFDIPERPVLSQRAYDFILRDRAFSGPNANQTYREAKEKQCPSINKLFYKIFDQIVLENNLKEFVNGPIGLRLGVNCLGVLPEGTGEGASAYASGSISMPSSIANITDSEDEVAFILAHEISHVLLGHAEYTYEYDRDTIPFPTPNNESQADMMGVILVANAGYNPEASLEALWHLNQFYNPILKFSPIMIKLAGDKGHGTLKERHARIQLSIAQSRIQIHENIGDSTDDLNAAKIEFREIKKSLGKP